MTLPPSSSDSAAVYALLHPAVKEWIWDQQWQQLRATQVRAIPPILAADRDVIVSAATASGKTEAAWLPICSALGFEGERGAAMPGVKALYIAPLKALINDQHARLRVLAEYLGIPVHRRHGDVTGSERAAIQRDPDGILLITPESLEAMFVLRGPRLPSWFQGLRYVVIDELHSFIGTERGAQIQSLLHRLELAIRRRVPRIALSATLADPDLATHFLRPDQGLPADVVTGQAGEGSELRMQLRGYVQGPDAAALVPPGGAESPEVTADQRAIAGHLYDRLRGSDNLVFANARRAVELYADLLNRMCDEHRVPNEFHPHHGSLARDLREDVEAMLKSSERPTTAICTSTLEMGIDIGSVDSVAQIGAPPSVASLRQRLGRSGRRGEPAVLRVYVSELALDARSSLVDQLRPSLVQAVAMLDLVLEHWYEPPNTGSLHLSTLVQQVLSVIAQHGGATATDIHRTLCERGPFASVNAAMFSQLLRDLGTAEILTQASDGTLLPGTVGERILNHYSFYAAFHTPIDYRLVTQGRTLGAIPIDFPIVEGDLLIFAGRRWRVVSVDTQMRVIDLNPARGGRPPLFGGSAAGVAEEVRRRMRTVLEATEVPRYLDETAQRFLAEGRAAYRRMDLGRIQLLAAGTGTIVLLWRGDRVVSTLKVLLTSQGFEVEDDRLALIVTRARPEAIQEAMRTLLAQPPLAGVDLARQVLVKGAEKYDEFLGEALLNEAYSARELDIPGAYEAMRDALDAI